MKHLRHPLSLLALAICVILTAVAWYDSSLLTYMPPLVDIQKSQVLAPTPSAEKMLLVLSAPSVHDVYYQPAFQKIVDFQIAYIEQIKEHDDVVLIVDADTKRYYEGSIPEDVLLIGDIDDIWMRDFTTVDPARPVQFAYTSASMPITDSRRVQKSFAALADTLNINRVTSEYLLDGGNIVDNYSGRIITTTRFMTDNHLSYRDAKIALKKVLGAREVAILEPDEDALAHSDGMVSWLDSDTLLVNDYSADPEYRKLVLDELTSSFPGVKLAEVPVAHTENGPGEWEGFASACGVNLNAAVTHRAVYVPTFGMKHESEVLEIMRAHTTKAIVAIPAEQVCPMGGSVRCLTWQVSGDAADKLIEAARTR